MRKQRLALGCLSAQQLYAGDLQELLQGVKALKKTNHKVYRQTRHFLSDRVSDLLARAIGPGGCDNFACYKQRGPSADAPQLDGGLADKLAHVSV